MARATLDASDRRRDVETRMVTPVATRRPMVRQSSWTWAVVGAVGSIGLALIGSSVGAIPDPGHALWWFSLPPGRSPALTIAFYGAAGLLIAAWIGVGFEARAGRLTSRRSWVLLSMWGIPLLIGPPLFSRDIYSYIGQGLIAHKGLNPYMVGPAVLGGGHVLGSIASVWRHTPTPYGPLFVSVIRLITSVFGNSVVAEVLAMRGLELLGIVLMMLFLPRLARSLGADPGIALWLGVLSPLALFSFVASGHNDALMIGLLVVGVTLAVEDRPVAGLLLCSLAMTVKIPAAAALLFITMAQLKGTAGRQRIIVVARAVLVPAITVVAVTMLSGLGWAWLSPSALQVPTEIRALSTPTVSLGIAMAHLAHLLGINVVQRTTVTVVQAVSAIAAVAVSLWLAIQARRLDFVRLLAIALLIVVLASPTVWPWYLMWGLSLLAATPVQRSKALAVGAALAMLLVGPSGTPILQGNSYVLVALACGAGCLWLVADRRWTTIVSGSVA